MLPSCFFFVFFLSLCNLVRSLWYSWFHHFSVFILQVLHQTFPQHTFLMNGLIHGVKVTFLDFLALCAAAGKMSIFPQALLDVGVFAGHSAEQVCSFFNDALINAVHSALAGFPVRVRIAHQSRSEAF